MLVLLKIPIVYLCMVVWWAIRAEPRDEQPTVAAQVSDTPSAPTSGGPGWTPRAGRRDPGRRGARTRVRVPSRPHAARSEVRS